MIDLESDGDCIRVPTGVQVDRPQGVNPVHVCLGELEVEDLEILDNSIFLPRFGEDDEAVLESPTQADLSSRLFVLRSKRCDDLVLHELVLVSCEGRVGLDGDVVLPAEVDGLGLPQQRMDLKLVDRWLDFGIFQKILKVVFEEIADPDVPHFPFFLQLHQGLPSLVPSLSVFRAVDIVFGHSRPMDDQKIQVSNLQPLQNTLTGLPCFLVTLLAWGNLAGNEYFAAIDLHFLQHLANHFFILVDGCSVDVSVACLQGPSHAFVTFLSPQLISPIANVRNLMA